MSPSDEAARVAGELEALGLQAAAALVRRQALVVDAAMYLRNSGYDGPFIGEVCRPLFAALAACERGE